MLIHNESLLTKLTEEEWATILTASKLLFVLKELTTRFLVS